MANSFVLFVLLISSYYSFNEGCEFLFECSYDSTADESSQSICSTDGILTTLHFPGNNGCAGENPDSTTRDANHECCPVFERDLEGPIDKIVGGSSVEASMYPFVAAYYHRESFNCGGSILRKESPAVILTAAHCKYKGSDSDTFVLLHADVTHDPNGIKLTVSSIKIHPNYNPSTADNDIALLFIDQDLTKYEELSTVKISPLPATKTECCNTGDDLTVIGYGRDCFGCPVTPTLEHVDIEYLSRSECGNGDPGRYRVGRITNNMICGHSSKGADSCQGDSGGPLFKKGTNEQVGIVSWGWGCATYPGVYTNIGIPDIYNWIIKETKLPYYKVNFYLWEGRDIPDEDEWQIGGWSDPYPIITTMDENDNILLVSNNKNHEKLDTKTPVWNIGGELNADKIKIEIWDSDSAPIISIGGDDDIIGELLIEFDGTECDYTEKWLKLSNGGELKIGYDIATC